MYNTAMYINILPIKISRLYSKIVFKLLYLIKHFVRYINNCCIYLYLCNNGDAQ